MDVKKTLCLLTALVMAVTLASCSKGGLQDKLDGDSTDFTLDYSRYSEGLDERGFFKGVTAKDIVTLPDYKNLEFPTKVDEAEVESLIMSALSSQADPIQIKDRPVKDGDTLNIDYVGSVDGVEFEGGNTQGKGTTVTIGVTSYIDDFLEQLIGHTPGENFDIEVTFPTPYQNNPDLAGKDAVFNITINYICQWEINDDSAAALGFENQEEMWEAAESQLLNEKVSTVINEMLEKATCDNIPQSVLDTVHLFNMLYFAEMVQSYYGVDLNTYLSLTGGTLETVEEGFRESDKAMALTLLATQAIAEIEGLEVTVEDITEVGYESAVKSYGEPYVRMSILSSVILPEFLQGNQE